MNVITMMTTTNQPLATKWLKISNKLGQVFGYIEGFWCASVGRYVTIPDVSRFKNGTLKLQNSRATKPTEL
jgi:hypothetical protein